MDRLQSLAKRKLDIDLSKLKFARDWGEDEDKYLAERKRLEKAYVDAAKQFYEAQNELLDFYVLYGDKNR